MAILPAAFVDWWFAPWAYASSVHASHHADLLGRRDGYRLWCAAAGVRPALPASFDAGWHALALSDGNVLQTSATLFGGLLAARAQQWESLGLLEVDDRKWCMSIASVQPLTKCAAAAYAPGEPLEICGLVELACHLERAFPGMWSRLRLLLPRDLDARVAGLLEKERAEGGECAVCEATDAASQRALRCWRLCRKQAEEICRTRASMPTNEMSET